MLMLFATINDNSNSLKPDQTPSISASDLNPNLLTVRQNVYIKLLAGLGLTMKGKYRRKNNIFLYVKYLQIYFLTWIDCMPCSYKRCKAISIHILFIHKQIHTHTHIHRLQIQVISMFYLLQTIVTLIRYHLNKEETVTLH